jgi:hypothetical protein
MNKTVSIVSFVAIFCLQLMLRADFEYDVHDLGITSDQNSARAMNQGGMVAGKFRSEEKIIDYLWDRQEGLQVITSDAVKDVYPRINNYGQVVGMCIDKTASWWQNAKQLYIYDSKQGFKGIGIPPGWGKEEISIIGINDKGRILICNDKDVFKARKFAIWDDGEFGLFKDERDFYLCAMNNHSDHLITCAMDLFFGLMNSYRLQIINYDTKEYVDFGHGTIYYGIALNDQRQVIAKNKEKTKGFFWSGATGMVPLNEFVPTALNNRGDIVGEIKKANDVNGAWLRMSDGTMVDLRESVRASLGDPAKMSQAWAINDQGQILLTAKIDAKERVFLLEPKKTTEAGTPDNLYEF